MNLLRERHGSALIEVSLILPILILLLLGVIDLGIVLEQAMTITDSARTGAEYATTSWQTATDVNGMKTNATNSAGTISGYTATAVIFCSCSTGGASISCTSSCSGLTPNQYAQVTAKAPIALVFGVQGLPASISFTSVARVRTLWTGGS